MSVKALPMGASFASVDRAGVIVPDPKATRDVSRVYEIKRGDWVRLLVEFKPVAADGEEPSRIDHEFLTGMVVDIADGQLTYVGPRESQPPQGTAPRIIRVKLLSPPSFVSAHELKYGDIVSVRPMNIVHHVPSSNSEHKREQHLLDDPMPAIEPAAGNRYWVRNGETAEVWTRLSDAQGDYYLGTIPGRGNIQWRVNGEHRGGNTDLDIVKDPRNTEIVAPGTRVLRAGQVETI